MKRSATTLEFGLPVGVAFLAMVDNRMVTLSDENNWYPFKVQVWDPLFYHGGSPRKDMEYVPLEKAEQRSGTSACPFHIRTLY